jgi:Brp/Blh family beta-carotene 15,15'-monooxygenase
MISAAAGRDRTVFRLAFVVPWVALTITAVAVLLFGPPSREYQLLPFAASIVLFGLPHGAVDHLTLPWALGEPPTRRWLAVVGGLYLVVGLAYAGVWFIAPVAAFGLFILITWFHWGQGDLQPLVELVDPTHLRTRGARLLTIAVRGSLPMALPLVAFPDDYRWVASRLVGLFGVDATLLDPLFSTTARTVVVAAIATLLITAIAVGSRQSAGRRAWQVDAGELVFLSVYFLTVPPILAIGVFFCFWHSVRHITRLLLLDDVAATRIAEGKLWTALGRFGRQATPLSIGALAIFGGLALAVPVAPVDWPDLFALYLVGIAVLTVPHIIIVTWLDFEAGFWSTTVDR